MDVRHPAPCNHKMIGQQEKRPHFIRTVYSNFRILSKGKMRCRSSEQYPKGDDPYVRNELNPTSHYIFKTFVERYNKKGAPANDLKLSMITRTQSLPGYWYILFSHIPKCRLFRIEWNVEFAISHKITKGLSPRSHSTVFYHVCSFCAVRSFAYSLSYDRFLFLPIRRLFAGYAQTSIRGKKQIIEAKIPIRRM